MELKEIPTFFMQSVGVGTLFYLALSTGIVNFIFDLFWKTRYAQWLHLDQMHLSSLIEKAFIKLQNSVFDVRSFLGIAIYIVGALIITVLLFRKRELEF